VGEVFQEKPMDVVMGQKGDTTSVWEIHPERGGNARLITRVRVKYRLSLPAILFNLLTEFFDILMMRKSMLGINKRAEKSL
jgi:hypothetical protein